MAVGRWIRNCIAALRRQIEACGTICRRWLFA